MTLNEILAAAAKGLAENPPASRTPCTQCDRMTTDHESGLCVHCNPVLRAQSERVPDINQQSAHALRHEAQHGE